MRREGIFQCLLIDVYVRVYMYNARLLCARFSQFARAVLYDFMGYCVGEERRYVLFERFH